MISIEKDHYSLSELMKRWSFSLQDIGYYAERGYLEVQTWLSDVLITHYKLKKTEDGEMVPVSVGIVALTGYYIVDANELRKVFRSHDGMAAVRKFISLNHRDVYSFQYKPEGLLINLSALEFCKKERDRFERENKIKSNNLSATITGIIATSAGRPSIMKKITERFVERVETGEIEPSLSAEARYLREWIMDEYGDIQAPAIKTIANNLRPHYAAYRETDARS